MSKLDGLEGRETGDGRDENLKVLAGIPRYIEGAHTDVRFREETESGFVQQHTLRGTAPDGHRLPLARIDLVKLAYRDGGVVQKIRTVHDDGRAECGERGN
ncbi:MAG: hypothetical protein RIC56_19135 [Pseudomonadales bacterium]